MLRYRLLLALALTLPLLYGGLWVTAQEKKPSPLEAIRGTWRADISATQFVLLDFRDDAVEMKINVSGNVVTAMTAKVVLPKEKSDQHMDWINVKSGERQLPDNKCLYRLAGETLLLMGGGTKERPARLYSGPGGEPKAFILTKVDPRAATE